MEDKDLQKESDSFSASDIGHGVLDVFGFIPGYGEAFDVANAAWYAAEDKYLDAGLSLIAVIPIVGDVIGKGGRVAKHLGPRATKTILEALQKIDVQKFLDKFRSNKDLAKHIDKIEAALNKWKDELQQIVNPKSSSKGIKKCPYQCTPTTNGAIVKANPKKTTTILGNYNKDMKRIINDELKVPKNTDFGPKKGGFNVLNVPDDMYKNADQFWGEVNKPFLDKVIERGDDILIATDPTKADVLYRSDGKLTGFGREIEHLYKKGYTYNPSTKMMEKTK
jgi:hypothetical protein